LVLDKCRVLAIQVGVIFGPHVPAATPRFIPDSKERNFPGFISSVLASQIGECRVRVGSHVFDPLHLFLRGATADVAVDVRVSAEHFAQVEEFVRAEGVVVYATPTRIWPARAFVAWSNAIAPMIFIGETTARPAQNRHAHFLQCGDDVVAEATGVGNG
jgi:hypothetical protein